MFGETTIFLIKIWNHPTETTIQKWMFRVPGLCLFTGQADWHSLRSLSPSDPGTQSKVRTADSVWQIVLPKKYSLEV